MKPPAVVGQRLEQVDTPALVLELDAFEKNLRTLADAVRAYPVRVRTHAKTHKCPEVAKRQMALGAVGACCQKVSEAEAMVEGGIGD
ncbi:MAG TPA: DSD1 family PLP-dependent enzyme, partial [Burkholderiales bacterium]|nr:DSD1 family PLP-dependent enzyme [Burkholderiales bacterium]